METLRFLMVSTHFPPFHLGGDAVHVEYLAKELSSRGHEVHVLYNPYASGIIRKSTRNKSERQHSGVVLHPLTTRLPTADLTMALMFGSSPTARRYLASSLRELHPDVVHWHNTKGLIGKPYAVPGAVNLYTAHDYFAVCARSNLIRPDGATCIDGRDCQLCHLRWRKPTPVWRYGTRKVMNLDSEIKVVSPSEFLARRLEREGVNISRVISNFVPSPQRDLSKIVMPENNLVYVGMLEAHKGVVSLLKAFADTLTNHEFTLTVVGNGSIKTHLEKMTDHLGIKERVHITGFISRDSLDEIRMRAAYQIVPSEWPENAPLTVLESLSFGVPVIGSDAGGLPEMLSDETGSIVFRQRSIENMARAIREAWRRMDDCTSTRERARLAYLKKYTPEAYLKEYMHLIKQPG